MSSSRSRAQVCWQIKLYSGASERLARHRTYDTLWQLYRMEKPFCEKVPEKVVSEVEECRAMIARYDAEVERVREALLARDDVDLVALADELEPAFTWRAEGRSHLGISYLRSLSAYARVEALGLAAVSAGDDGVVTEARLADLRSEWLKLGSALRKRVYELAEREGLEDLAPGPSRGENRAGGR